MVPKQTQKRGGDSSKGGLVQFRADDRLLSRLTEVANRYNLPVGTLSRLWVSERLEKELTQDLESINAWLAERYPAIDSLMHSDYEHGPMQVLHLVPFVRPQEISPEDVRRHQGLLPPVERVDEYLGKINLSGYFTVKQFKSADKPTGYVQVFKSGELESVRILQHNEIDKFLFADRIDSDLIRSIWSYSTALGALGVSPPTIIQVRFAGMKGFSLCSSKLEGASPEIDVDKFVLPAVKISDWNQISDIERVADILKKPLDALWNAAGVSRSHSYSVNGDWLGPEEEWGEPKFGSRKVTSIRKEVLDLSGINPTPDRVDLLMHYLGSTYLIGKVRIPYITPNVANEFACRVYQNEMDHRAKAMLETASYKGDIVEFTAGNLKLKGRISRIIESYAAGSFDGVNVPLQRTLMLSFQIQPVA